MIVDLDNNLYSIWYENGAGERFVPDLESLTRPADGVPEGFIYQHSEFARRVVHDALKIVQPSEVASCPHPYEHERKDLGLIDGFKGRRCAACGGHQTVPLDAEWPETWKASGSIPLFQGSSGYPGELVLAMTRPTDEERQRAYERRVDAAMPSETNPDGGFIEAEPKFYSLDDAILIAARACEGCMNVLFWRYGCNDGYPEGSDEHTVGCRCGPRAHVLAAVFVLQPVAVGARGHRRHALRDRSVAPCSVYRVGQELARAVEERAVGRRMERAVSGACHVVSAKPAVVRVQRDRLPARRTAMACDVAPDHRRQFHACWL